MLQIWPSHYYVVVASTQGNVDAVLGGTVDTTVSYLHPPEHEQRDHKWLKVGEAAGMRLARLLLRPRLWCLWGFSFTARSTLAGRRPV
jgi:tRNA(Met) C34 N-acetyltransferase TmcA